MKCTNCGIDIEHPFILPDERDEIVEIYLCEKCLHNGDEKEKTDHERILELEEKVVMLERKLDDLTQDYYNHAKDYED